MKAEQKIQKFVILHARPRDKESRSAALVLVEHVWNHIQEATAHSWQRLNWAMSDAVTLAIRAGLEFDAGDFEHIADNFRPGYWMGETMGEYLYVAAVTAGNLSACKSFEQWKERPAFVLGGRRLTHGSTFDDYFGEYSRTIRGTVESKTEWLGYPQAKLSTFRDDKNSFVVSSHWDAAKRSRKEGGAPVRRWVVTREMVSAASKILKKAKTPKEPAAESAA